MSQKKYTLLVVGALLLGACNNNEENQKGNYPSDGLVRINTTISELKLNGLEKTRADGSRPYGGTDLSLSIDYGSGKLCTRSNVKWTRNGSTWNTAPNMYWESAEKEAKIYAYAPYIDRATDIGKIWFSVETDQRLGIEKSDLLGYTNYSFKPNYNLSSANDLDITLAHKFSKLTLKLSFKSNSEFGTPPPPIERVTLNGTRPTVIYNAKEGKAVIEPSIKPTAINMRLVSATDKSYEVILVPQAIEAATNMITVELTGGYTSNYTVPTGARHVFESGSAYKMDLIVGKEKMELGSITVIDWKSGTSPTPGEVAKMEMKYEKMLGGDFNMGTLNDITDPNIQDNEKPQHKVTLSPFYMSKYEITNAQYCIFLNANKIGSTGVWSGAKFDNRQVLIYGSKAKGSDWGVNWDGGKWVPAEGKDNFPVVYVTWYGAKEFALFVGGDLPTEAQWEYACRAGTNTPWATEPDGVEKELVEYAWYTRNSEKKTHIVGTRTENGYKLCDMHGNVAEWCNDWYGSYTSDTPTDPTGPIEGSYRLARGGSWDDYDRICRSACRFIKGPTESDQKSGFRVAVSVPK